MGSVWLTDCRETTVEGRRLDCQVVVVFHAREGGTLDLGDHNEGREKKSDLGKRASQICCKESKWSPRSLA